MWGRGRPQGNEGWLQIPEGLLCRTISVSGKATEKSLDSSFITEPSKISRGVVSSLSPEVIKHR